MTAAGNAVDVPRSRTEGEIRDIARDEVAAALLGRREYGSFHVGDHAEQPVEHDAVADRSGRSLQGSALDLLAANGLLRKTDVAQVHNSSPSSGVTSPPSVGADAPVEGETPSPSTERVEYAIRLGDGSFVTDYGEYHVGEFVATWTDIAIARDECFRVRTAGLIPRNENLRDAQLVSREVPAWQPVPQWHDSEATR